jgi:hypothetical protein
MAKKKEFSTGMGEGFKLCDEYGSHLSQRLSYAIMDVYRDLGYAAATKLLKENLALFTRHMSPKSKGKKVVTK